MTRRRAAARKNGAAVCEAIGDADVVRRHELGVEALCQLSADMLTSSMKNPHAEAPDPLCHQYWGISHAALAKPVPDALRKEKMSVGALLWKCLNRATELSKVLVRVHSKVEWRHVQETIVAWQDAWGDDARASYAQMRFTTLTGIVRGAKEDRDAYLYAALAKALSDIQA